MAEKKEEDKASNFITITSESQYQPSIEGKLLVIADFNATWCPPCKQLKPLLHKLAKEIPDLTVLDIDVDKNREFAKKFNVSSIPHIIVYMNGKQVKQIIGFDKPFFEETIPKAMGDIRKGIYVFAE